MNRAEIISSRLFNQRISTTGFEKPDEVVAHFGAMQAQDYAMALWAIGQRMKTPNRKDIETQINSGKIIRIHILRPTWHFVHQNDIRWMMKLSAPQVKKATQYVDRKEGLTDDLFKKAWKIIEPQFNKVDYVTKADIMACLSRQGMVVSNLLATQLIIRAELEMLLCNGLGKGTYALFEKRVPATDNISKSEALTKLTQLYFQSRGPATLKDLAWWSGMSLSDAKIGIAELGRQLQVFTTAGLTYYHFEDKKDTTLPMVSALLPCYDEYTVGYSEGRSIVLPAESDGSAIGNGIFKPTILSENEIVGTWKKSKKSPFVEIQVLSSGKTIPSKKRAASIERFTRFNNE